MTTKWSIIKARKGHPTYKVTAEKDGRFWFLRVEGRDDLFTQAVSLEHAEAMVRDLIATMDQVPPDSFDIRIEPKLDDQVDEAVAALDHLRLVDALGAALRRSLAVALVREKGLSMRDAGKILGLSHQRVDQLLAEHDELGGDKRPDLAYYIETLDSWADRRGTRTWRVGDDPRELEAMARGVTDAP